MTAYPGNGRLYAPSYGTERHVLEIDTEARTVHELPHEGPGIDASWALIWLAKEARAAWVEPRMDGWLAGKPFTLLPPAPSSIS